MQKTLKHWQRENREKLEVPQGVQCAIPIQVVYEDGIFLVRSGKGSNKYSKTFSFTDINYAVASKEDKERMFLDYSELLNALDSGATAKITVRARLGSQAETLDAEARLKIFHDFYRPGDESDYHFNMKAAQRRGHSFKDSMIFELTELNQNLVLSIDIRPVTMEEAVREVEKRVLGVETNITQWQRRQNSNNNLMQIPIRYRRRHGSISARLRP